MALPCLELPNVSTYVVVVWVVCISSRLCGCMDATNPNNALSVTGVQ